MRVIGRTKTGRLGMDGTAIVRNLAGGRGGLLADQHRGLNSSDLLLWGLLLGWQLRSRPAPAWSIPVARRQSWRPESRSSSPTPRPPLGDRLLLLRLSHGSRLSQVAQGAESTLHCGLLPREGVLVVFVVAEEGLCRRLRLGQLAAYRFGHRHR